MTSPRVTAELRARLADKLEDGDVHTVMEVLADYHVTRRRRGVLAGVLGAVRGALADTARRAVGVGGRLAPGLPARALAVVRFPLWPR